MSFQSNEPLGKEILQKILSRAFHLNEVYVSTGVVLTRVTLYRVSSNTIGKTETIFFYINFHIGVVAYIIHFRLT